MNNSAAYDDRHSLLWKNLSASYLVNGVGFLIPWTDVAYTWSYPTSHWKKEAIKALDEGGIIQTGRYGRWPFQGIADSIKEGFEMGKEIAS
jgi:hypothetical protein